MRFSICDITGDELSLLNNNGTVSLHVSEGNRSVEHTYDKEAFRQLRRAVGYIWEELERGEK